MLSKFIKRLAAAVVVSHIAITTGLHYYGKKKQNGQTDDLEDTEVKGQATKPEEDKLLAWLSYLNGIPLIKDIAKNTKQLNRKLTVRDDDVYIISYPKSGTTWLSEMVFNIVHDMDIIRSKETRLDQRVPYIEWVGTDLSELDLLEKQDRRVFKSHLPLVLLPEKIKSSPCKIIYIMRNPRDVAVSYYHFTKMVKPVSYKGEFADFFELFLTGRVAYGDWCGHVTDYWQLAQSESQQHRVMFLSYEEMSENPVEVARRLSIFLEQPMDEFKLKILAHYCSFNKMKGNPSANYDWLEQSHFKVKGVPFLRKGIVGDWKNHLNSDMVQALNRKVDEKIQDSDLKEAIKYV